MLQDVRPERSDRSRSGTWWVAELIRARATDLRDHPADPRADAKPVETGESRVVRSLMVGLLPAGLLWLTVLSLLRGILG
jgi:hypothetical protein